MLTHISGHIAIHMTLRIKLWKTNSLLDCHAICLSQENKILNTYDVGFLAFTFFVYAILLTVSCFYHINKNFNAVQIIFFDCKNAYIMSTVCVTCCIFLQESMHISTEVYSCILFLSSMESSFHGKAGWHSIVNFWSFHAAYGTVTLTERSAPVMNSHMNGNS